MNVLVVGAGAREHALVWKLAASSRIGRIYTAPGNAGTQALAERLPLQATDVDGVLHEVSRRSIDLTVVGPEEPLARGLADHLRAHQYPVVGPSQAAARIESSKVWAKQVMASAGVPTARSIACNSLAAVMAASDEIGLPVVLKADGLAAGKGVVICATEAEVADAAQMFLVDRALGSAGETVLVEEYLQGMEVSLLALTDGETVVPLLPACDYKRVGEGDTGPNTGGMGAYTPPKAVDGTMVEAILRDTIVPTLAAMRAEGVSYQGVLYAGMMLTETGPKVLEFNCRFGDPETQVILPMLNADLLELFVAVAKERLARFPALDWFSGACVGVVLASGGYPGAYTTGHPIRGLETLPEGGVVFHAGTRWRVHDIVTAGGRVLTAVGRGPDMATARELAYATADAIDFEGKYVRRDIALRELE
ncbi:MAG: phosphoribosylamine--glycine ligase [Chloroflexi bacterium]|nr:MAG: phosphoribosylamine--glycine ligase [Chloroflexota bacterium]